MTSAGPPGAFADSAGCCRHSWPTGGGTEDLSKAEAVGNSGYSMISLRRHPRWTADGSAGSAGFW